MWSESSCEAQLTSTSSDFDAGGDERMWALMVVILLLVPSSSSVSITTPTYTTSVSSSPARCHLTTSSTPPRATTYHNAHQSKFPTHSDANRNYSREYVNHVTRINISNDFPQAEGGNGEPEAVVKEGESQQSRERHGNFRLIPQLEQ